MNNPPLLIRYPSKLLDESTYERSDVATLLISLSAIASNCDFVARILKDALDSLEHERREQHTLDVEMQIDELTAPIKDAITAVEKAETLFLTAVFAAFK